MKSITQHISESLFANQIKGESRNSTSFALFPIRIETRFMNMSLPQVKERNKVLASFRQINLILNHAIYNYYQHPEVVANRKLLAQELSCLANSVGYLDGIYREDKILLEELLAEMHKPVDYLVSRLPESERSSSLNTMRHILRDLTSYAKTIPTLNSMKSDKATKLLAEYRQVCNRIKAISMLKSTPYCGYHFENPMIGNVKLISHLNKHLAECLEFVKTLPQIMESLPSMSADQRAAFTRYTKLLLTGKEYEKITLRPSVNIHDTKGYLRLAYDNIQIVHFRFDKNLWIKEKEACTAAYYGSILKTIWTQLWSSYADCRGILNNKPLSSVRYTHLIHAALSMKLNYVSSFMTEGPKYKFKIDTLQKLASKACYDCRKGKSFTATLLAEINDISKASNPVDLTSLFQTNMSDKQLKGVKREQGKKSYCLCVRIFPDEIGVNRFVSELTRQEEYDGMAFWLRHKMAECAGNPELMKAAWSMLCDRYSPCRAGWIARKLRPDDKLCSKFNDMFGVEARESVSKRKMEFINEMVARYISDSTKARESEIGPFFPKVEYRDPNDFGKPVSPVLPDRFVFEGKVRAKGHKPFTIVKYGRRVFPDLQVAIDFNENLDIDPFLVDSAGTLTVNSGIRWMTSYAMAEKMGMAITIPLDGLEDISFESVYVMGVKNGSASEAKRLIDNTFLSHYYSEEGLDLLKVGTSTNILDDKAADASYDTSRDALSEMHYQHDVLEPNTSVTADSDAGRLAGVLGTSKGSLNSSVLARVAHAGNSEIQRSVLSNSCLADYFFPSYTRNPQGSTHEQRKLQGFAGRVHNFISNDISSRGVYPPIRIGSQPYGVVPVTDFGNFMCSDDNLYQLSQLLIWLTKKWNAMAEKHVIYEGNIAGTGNDDMVKNYIEMIGCTPTSSTFYVRDYIENRDLLNSVYFKGNKNDVSMIQMAEDFISSVLKLPTKYENNVGFTIRTLMKQFDRLPIEKKRGVNDKYLNQIDNPWGTLPDRLKHISNSPEECEQLVAEFFDLFSYRLDAWTMGLLNYTIRRRIKKGMHKLRIGAFGWVFDLRPDKKEKKSEEYILAPSITHAITGAVLRSSYLKSMDKGGDVRLCVNLSSVRVREALRIIRGIQNGLSVGAILGSDLERYLHDSWKVVGEEMDAFIYPLRQMYPLVADVTKADENAESRIHTTIINGEDLIYDLRKNIFCNDSSQLVDLFKSSRMGKNDKLKKFLETIGNDNSQKLEILFLQIQRMEDSFDALRDVIMSESVYKLAEGNRVAVDALMNCIQQGRNVPMPDVVEVPMHSAHIEQHVIAALNTEAYVSNDDETFMKLAEPAVDSWIDNMLSDYSRIEAGFMRGNRMDVRSLSKCGVSASELVYLSGNGDSFKKFIEWSFARCNDFAWIPKLAPSMAMGENSVSLNEAEFIMDSLRDMLIDARILKADDLLMENVNPESEYDIADLESRFERLYSGMSALKKRMEEFASENSLFSIEGSHPMLSRLALNAGAGFLLDCYSAGITNALDGLDFAMFPPDNISSDPQAYVAAAGAQDTFRKSFVSIYGQLCERLAKVDLKELKTLKSASKYVESAQNLLLKSFKMVPKLQFHEPKFSRFEVDNEFIYDWITDAAKVRKPVSDIQTIRMFSRLHDFAEPEYQVMQLPGDAKRWIGDGTGDIDESMIDDAKSYVVVNSEFFYGKSKTIVAALVLDSWVERIPYKTQTAALAFSYDQPDAEAPHAILLTVSPNIKTKRSAIGEKYISKNWSPIDFIRSIKSSMHLVKTRAVEPDHIYKDKFASAFFPILNVEHNKK